MKLRTRCQKSCPIVIYAHFKTFWTIPTVRKRRIKGKAETKLKQIEIKWAWEGENRHDREKNTRKL